MKIQRFTGTINFLAGRIFDHNPGAQAIVTYTDRSILIGNELVIDIKPANMQAAGTLKLKTEDRMTFIGDFTYKGHDKPDAKAMLKFYENEVEDILIGEWEEDSQIYTVNIKLLKVAKFVDSSGNESMLNFV